MFTKNEKSFFADVTWGASRLSACDPKKGAVLINGHQIQSYGFNKSIIKNREWEISAIYDTLFGSTNINMSNFVLFTTCFPCLNEMVLIISVGISTIYFFGEITDVNSVKFVNSLKDAHIPLEIIKLEQNKI